MHMGRAASLDSDRNDNGDCAGIEVFCLGLDFVIAWRKGYQSGLRIVQVAGIVDVLENIASFSVDGVAGVRCSGAQ